jgi:hypothetical protein
MHLRPGYFLLLAASLLAPASLRAQQQTLSTPDHQEMDFAATAILCPRRPSGCREAVWSFPRRSITAWD